MLAFLRCKENKFLGLPILQVQTMMDQPGNNSHWSQKVTVQWFEFPQKISNYFFLPVQQVTDRIFQTMVQNPVILNAHVLPVFPPP